MEEAEKKPGSVKVLADWDYENNCYKKVKTDNGESGIHRSLLKRDPSENSDLERKRGRG